MLTTFSKQKSSGFTLLEVMITVAILSILAVFAIANYRPYITKTHLQEGQNALQANYLFLETFYSKHNAYGRKDKDKNFIPLQVSDLPIEVTGSGKAGYDISVHSNCDTNDDRTGDATFCLKATPRSGQAAAKGGGKECGTLSVNQAGKYTAENDPDKKFKCFK